jgi:HPt (histidine-containing phosphotransfer) domain-containing protein
MGDEELFNSILNQFLLETHEDVTALEENMKFLDVKKIRERVHKLAGRIGQVGADKISQRLRTIEDDIVEGKNINELADRIFSSITEVQKLVDDIKAEISV